MPKDKDYNAGTKKAEDVTEDAEYQATLARVAAARAKAAEANKVRDAAVKKAAEKAKS